METLFLVFVIILFILAFSDLIVGVSNDAVNFLNSAIGSKVATKRTIFLIASAGIILGATFSSGMMEVARKGIFHPEMFTFSQVMIIFLAVMLTDVILLDLFNTYAMPTSTTVSIVFELLGSAVAVGLIALNLQSDASLHLGDYINTGSALTIVSGILLSIIIAFTLGAIVQYFVRLIFTFDYEKNLKYFGSVFGGIAITAITYFILIKGAKGASFLTDDIQLAIRQNAGLIILVSFIVWTLLLQVGISFSN